jgi:peroxiredoxin
MIAAVPLLSALVPILIALLVFAPPAGAESAPGFRVKLLDSRVTFDSRDQFGKNVVVVRFQTSYCKPCGRESAALSRLADRYRARGVEVIALQVQDTANDVRRFIRTHRVSYRVALDPRLAIGNTYGFKGAPLTVVVDRKGEIVTQIEGSSAVARLPKILDEVLAQQAEPSK